MKGPVILLLVALAVSVDQAASDTEVAPWMDIPLLLEYLGEPMPGEAKEAARKVYDLLFKTRDKESIVAKLKGFSVGRLVELNHWSVEDCENDKLEERSSICKKFSTRELTNLVRPPKHETEDGDLVISSNDQIDLNVGKYCWKTMEVLERSCPAKRVQALFEDGSVRKRFATFNFKVYRGQWSPGQFLKPDFRKLVAKKLEKLEKENAAEAAALKENCFFIMNEYNKPEARFDKMGLYFSQDLVTCKTMVELDTVKGQAELDKASLPATQFADDNQASS